MVNICIHSTYIHTMPEIIVKSHTHFCFPRFQYPQSKALHGTFQKRTINVLNRVLF